MIAEKDAKYMINFLNYFYKHGGRATKEEYGLNNENIGKHIALEYRHRLEILHVSSYMILYIIKNSFLKNLEFYGISKTKSIYNVSEQTIYNRKISYSEYISGYNDDKEEFINLCKVKGFKYVASLYPLTQEDVLILYLKFKKEKENS